MALPVRPGPRRVRRRIDPALMEFVQAEYGPAWYLADRARRAHPMWNRTQQSWWVVAHSGLRMAGTAAVTGGVGSVPVVGRVSSFVVTGVDAKAAIPRLVRMVMAVGFVWGHEGATLADAAGWCQDVLPVRTTELGRRFTTLAGSRAAATTVARKLGKAAPYTIGAGVAALDVSWDTVNVGRKAISLFAPPGETIRRTHR